MRGNGSSEAPLPLGVGGSLACAADPTCPSFSSFLKLGIRAAGGGAAASSTQASYDGMPKSSATQPGTSGGQGAPAPAPTSQDPPPAAGPATVPAPRPLGSIQRPNSFLFRSSSQSGSGPSSPDCVLRPRRSPQLLDEKELMAQLRQVLESRLQRPLPEDLAEALANGVILCQLANQLRPRSVPFIHVPSPAVPKLSALKSRKNVESFLEACRKMGVPEVWGVYSGEPRADPSYKGWRRSGLS